MTKLRKKKRKKRKSKKRLWTLATEYMNCGSPACKMGCVDQLTHEKLEARPHGPYHALFRRATAKGTRMVHERIRIGNFCPSESDMRMINANIGNPIPAHIWNDKEARVEHTHSLREDVFLLMTRQGYEPDELMTLFGERRRRSEG